MDPYLYCLLYAGGRIDAPTLVNKIAVLNLTIEDGFRIADALADTLITADQYADIINAHLVHKGVINE